MLKQTYAFETAAEIDALIASATRMKAVSRIELLEAVRAGQLAMFEFWPGGAYVAYVLNKLTRSAVAVIGDHHSVGPAASGPAGWAAMTPWLLSWAKGALVHVPPTRGSVPICYLAILMARKSRRFAVIETDAAHATEWCQTLRAQRIPCTLVLPWAGAANSLPLMRNTTH